MQVTGKSTRPSFAGRCGVVLFCLSVLTACGPQIELPPLPSVSTEGFLDDVKKQIQGARASVDANPTDSQVNGRYGMILGAYGHDPAASVAFDRARRLSPDQPRWAYYHSFILRRLGKTQEALQALDAVLAVNPGQLDALARRAEVYFDLARFDEAQRDVGQVLASNARYPLAQYYAGRIHSQRKEWPEAIARYERMLNDGINVTEVHNHLGAAYRMIGNTDKAAHHLTRARSNSSLKIAGFDPVIKKFNELNVGDQPYVVRAAEFYRRGELDKALGELKIAHKKNPDNVGTHVHLVRFYGQAKNLNKSLYHFRRARELDPNFSQLHSNMGFAYQYAGQYDDAVSAYQEALRQAPDRPGVHAELGFVLRKSGELEQALVHYEQSLKLQPVNRDLRFILGETLVSMRRFPDAIRTFQSALTPVDQKTIEVYRALARTHMLSANREAALDALQQAKVVAIDYGNDAMIKALDSDINKVNHGHSGP